MTRIKNALQAVGFMTLIVAGIITIGLLALNCPQYADTTARFAFSGGALCLFAHGKDLFK